MVGGGWRIHAGVCEAVDCVSLFHGAHRLMSEDGEKHR